MATTETKILDNIIASRRALLVSGGAAMAALAVPGLASAAATAPATITDAMILNFALNLEYLEANFYYLAAFGTTIDAPNAASNAAYVAATPGSTLTTVPAIGINGVANGTNPTAGVTATFGTGGRVPFALPTVQSYAIETAIEEGKHVSFLRGALGSAAVAQPPIDISPAGAFTKVAMAAQVPAAFIPFNPYAADANFLIGAYIFEDVGVTAYHGAAPLLQQTTAGKQNLLYAGGILAVEAYHAGLIRTVINNLDPTGTLGYLGLTQSISKLRANLAFAGATSPNANGAFDNSPDDVPLLPETLPVSLAGAATTGASVANADPTTLIAFARTTTQVLNIVTGGGGVTPATPATGVFFPMGLNGTFV